MEQDHNPQSNAVDEFGMVRSWGVELGESGGRLVAELQHEEVDSNLKSIEVNALPPPDAASYGRSEVVSLPQGRTACRRVNEKDRQGETVLLAAVKRGQLEIVREFLGWEGVDVNAQDNDGYSPLSVAVMTRNEELLRLLLEREDLDKSPRDKFGYTPLRYAEMRSWEIGVRLLTASHVGDIM